MSSYLDEEIRRHPLEVSMGSIILGTVVAPAPADPTDPLWVVLPPLVEPSTNNLAQQALAIPTAYWLPTPTFAQTNGVWGITGISFPAVGDAVLLNFDNYGQLWALASTSSYRFPVGAS